MRLSVVYVVADDPAAQRERRTELAPCQRRSVGAESPLRTASPASDDPQRIAEADPGISDWSRPPRSQVRAPSGCPFYLSVVRWDRHAERLPHREIGHIVSENKSTTPLAPQTNTHFPITCCCWHSLPSACRHRGSRSDDLTVQTTHPDRRLSAQQQRVRESQHNEHQQQHRVLRTRW